MELLKRFVQRDVDASEALFRQFQRDVYALLAADEPTPKPLVSWPRSEIRGPRFDRLRFQFRQCGLSVPPLAGLDVVLSGAASEILQDVCLQRWRGEREMILGDVAGQLTVGKLGSPAFTFCTRR